MPQPFAIASGSILWLKAEANLDQRDHPVLVLSPPDPYSSKVPILLITSFGSTLLEDKFPGEHKRSKRRKYIPLKRTPPRPHVDDLSLLEVRMTGAPSVTQSKQSYVSLEKAIWVESGNLERLKRGTVTISLANMRMVMDGLRRECPSEQVDMLDEAIMSTSRRSRQRSDRSSAHNPSTRSTPRLESACPDHYPVQQRYPPAFADSDSYGIGRNERTPVQHSYHNQGRVPSSEPPISWGGILITMAVLGVAGWGVLRVCACPLATSRPGWILADRVVSILDDASKTLRGILCDDNGGIGARLCNDLTIFWAQLKAFARQPASELTSWDSYRDGAKVLWRRGGTS